MRSYGVYFQKKVVSLNSYLDKIFANFVIPPAMLSCVIHVCVIADKNRVLRRFLISDQYSEAIILLKWSVEITALHLNEVHLLGAVFCTRILVVLLVLLYICILIFHLDFRIGFAVCTFTAWVQQIYNQ